MYRFGRIEKMVLPPSKTLCIIVFEKAKDAKKAFTKLAYKRYKNSPLYLQWAPENVIVQKSPQEVEASVFPVRALQPTARAVSQVLALENLPCPPQDDNLAWAMLR